MVGMEGFLWLHRREEGWQGQRLGPLSIDWVREESLAQRDKRTKYASRQGLRQGRAVVLRLPAEALGEGALPQPGDLLVDSESCQVFASPAQLRQRGISFCVIEQVEDRRQGPLPHVKLKGR